MGTMSSIIIKVRKEDIGMFKKFNSSLLPVKLSDWDCYGNEVDKEKSRRVKLTSPYIGIYCHSCGCTDEVGDVLKSTFQRYEQVLNLIVGGSCSVIWYDKVRHYANRIGEKWEWIKPALGDTPKSVYEQISCEYSYLFDEDGWRVCEDFDSGNFVEY